MSSTKTPRGHHRPPHPSDRSSSVRSTNSSSIGGHSSGNNNNNNNIISSNHSSSSLRRRRLSRLSGSSAHQTTRRLQVWVRQQWRGIPAATFDSKGGNGGAAAAGRHVLRQGTKNKNKVPSPLLATSPPTAAAAIAQVSNIDEALGALSSDYHIDNNVIHCVGRRLNFENNDDDAQPATFDWMLDGYPEWHEQYQKTADLMEQLYPKTGDNFSTHLVLQFGSAMGQQEYQFASFPSEEGADEAQEESSNKELPVKNGTSTKTPDNASATPHDNNNFAQFWHTAVTAPTPQQTFDMGSSSTYATGEDVEDNAETEIDPIDVWLVEKMAAKALGLMTPQLHHPPEVEPEANSEDDDDEFGDFQEADTSGVDNVAGETEDDPSTQETAAANPQDDDGYENDDPVADNEATARPIRDATSDHSNAENHLLHSNVEIIPSNELDSKLSVAMDESAQASNSAHIQSPSKLPLSTNNGLRTPAASPPTKSVNDEHYSVLEPPTPITRNYYPSPIMTLEATGVDSPTSPFPHQFGFPRQCNDDSGTGRGVLSPNDQASERGDDGDEEDDGSSTRGESSLWTHTSMQDQPSIPREVQLKVPTNVKSTDSPSISIPQTVRVASTSFANFSSSSFYFGRNSSLFATSMLDGGEDEPSIASSIASPEVKFLRRRKKSLEGMSLNTPEASRNRKTDHGDENEDGEDDFDEDESVSLGSLGTLPENYLKHPDLDYTLKELKKLEWDWLPFWKMERLLDEEGEFCDTTNIPLLQDQITQRLSKLDAFYRKVCKKVYKKIQPHAEEIIVANQATLDLQKNLQLAKMYLERTQQAIETAKYGSYTSDPIDGFGVYGAMELLKSWDNLASQKGLEGVIESISEMFESEESILKRIQAFDVYRSDSLAEYQAIAKLVHELRNKCQAQVASRLKCLDNLRARVDWILPKTFNARLHEWLEELTVQWCHRDTSESSASDQKAYEQLMGSFCRLHQGDAPDDNHLKASSRAICTTIQTALLLECQKAFGRALLWPSGFDDEVRGQYSRELEALEYNESFLDAARIPSWTHNLVTIRFDFEIKDGNKHPLPPTLHKLCLLLTNILRSMHALIEWHKKTAMDLFEKKDDADMTHLLVEISQELPQRRASLWNACVQSMEDCLEEYLKFSGNKRLFVWTGDTCDDSNWFQDLQGLQDVSALLNQLLSLGPLFLEGIPADYVNDGSRIREKFHLCCKRHVRTFHVETMNSLGGMLYREDWILLAYPGSSATSSDAGKAIIEAISKQLFESLCNQREFEYRSQCNGFTKAKDEYCLVKDFGTINPFAVLPCDEGFKNSHKPGICQEVDWNDDHIVAVAKSFNDALSEKSVDMPRVMTKSMICGILPWCARVFVLIDTLPSMANEAILVLTNIFDLYITTAFRICAGNGNSERILLGIDRPHRLGKEELDALLQSRFSSQAFGFGRRTQQPTNNSKTAMQVSKFVEAEMCSLVLENENERKLSCLRDIVVNGQNNLKSIAKLDLVDKWILDPPLTDETDEEDFAMETARVLEKRIAASFNVLSLAATLHLSALHLASFDERLSKLRDSVLSALPLFLDLTSRMCAMRSIRGTSIVTEIASNETVWEESKLHEHPNEYVDNLGDFSVLLWKYLQTSSNRLPQGVLNSVWEGIVGGGFMAFLEGFSKVACCSTEGRSLMSMDVAAFSSEMSSRSIREKLSSELAVAVPSNIRPYRNAGYVDTYIKMFYFPHKDVVVWVQDNFQNYHLQHVLPLVLATASTASEARSAIETVVKLYGGTGGNTAKTIRL